MPDRVFHKRLFEAVRERIPPGSTCLCAVSGGADSMAMLHGLLAANEIHRRGWSLRVAHLDHQLRADSADVARFVQEMAAASGLPCSIEVANVAREARRAKEGIEETARRLRYGFLARVAAERGASVVAVAHHADDQAETILHRIIRGTGLRGLGGIPESLPLEPGGAVMLVRPVLGFRRRELADYLRRRGIAHRHDGTNDDVAGATRNRIRHAVLPMLERDLNPKSVEALLRLARQSRRAGEAIRHLAERTLFDLTIDSGPGRLGLNADHMATVPAAVQNEIIVLAIERLGVGLKPIGNERIEAATALVGGDGRRRAIELPGNLRVERRGRRLTIHVVEHPAAGRVAAPEAPADATPVCR